MEMATHREGSIEPARVERISAAAAKRLIINRMMRKNFFMGWGELKMQRYEENGKN